MLKLYHQAFAWQSCNQNKLIHVVHLQNVLVIPKAVPKKLFIQDEKH